MTQSKPNIFKLGVIALLLLLAIVAICILLIELLMGVTGTSIAILTFITMWIVFGALFYSLIELPVILALTIDDDKIEVRNLVTRRSKVFLFENIHSFKISIQMQGYLGFNLELVLLRHGEMIESISLSYIGNLDEIITELEKHLRNLTEDEYGFLQYIRERQVK